MLTGTAIPTQFTVFHNSSTLTVSEITRITHDLCYGYTCFNGPICIPNVTKYAKKVAIFVDVTKSEAKGDMIFKKYFVWDGLATEIDYLSNCELTHIAQSF